MKAPATIATGISVGKTFSSTPGVGISLNLRPSITHKAASFSPSRGELPGSGFINTKFSFRESLNGSLSRPTANINKSTRPVVDISRPTQVNLTSADKQEARLKTAQERSNTILAVIQFGNPVRLPEHSRSTDGRTGVSRRSLLTAAARPSSLGVIGEINRANRVNSPDVAISKKTPILREGTIELHTDSGLLESVFTSGEPVTQVTKLPEAKPSSKPVSGDVVFSSVNFVNKEEKTKKDLMVQQKKEPIATEIVNSLAPDVKIAKGLIQVLKRTPEIVPQTQKVADNVLIQDQPIISDWKKTQVETLSPETQTQVQQSSSQNSEINLTIESNINSLPKALTPVTRRSILAEQIKFPVTTATNNAIKETPSEVVSLTKVKAVQRELGADVLSSRINNDEEEKKKKTLATLAEQAQRESIVAGLIRAFAPDIKVAKGLVQILKQTPELAPQAQELAFRALTKVQPRLLTLGKAQVEALVVEQQTQVQGRGAKNGRVDLAVSGAWGPVYGYVLAERTWAKRYLATQQGLEGLAVKNAKTGKESVDLLVLKYWLRQERGLNSPIVAEGKDHAWNDTLEIIGKAGIQERFAAERFVSLLNGWTKPVDYRESGIPVEEEHILRLFNKVEYRKFMGWLKGVFGVAADIASVTTKDIPVDPVAKAASQVVDSFAA